MFIVWCTGPRALPMFIVWCTSIALGLPSLLPVAVCVGSVCACYNYYIEYPGRYIIIYLVVSGYKIEVTVAKGPTLHILGTLCVALITISVSLYVLLKLYGPVLALISSHFSGESLSLFLYKKNPINSAPTKSNYYVYLLNISPPAHGPPCTV